MKKRMRALLDKCEISNVYATDFSASRVSGSSEPVTVRASNEVSFHVSETSFANRYEWSVQLVDSDGAPVADLAASVVVDYSVMDGFAPDEEAAAMIAETTGFFAAYPYVRELFQSNTARLQLNPLVLGLVMRGTQMPRNHDAKDGRSGEEDSV